MNNINLNRWRLILGENSNMSGEMSNEEAEMENLLSYLYNRDDGERGDIRGEGSGPSGGMGKSQLTVPKWIDEINKVFPKEAIEIMEKDALEKYNLTELLGDSRVLEKLNPNKELLKNILSLKGALNGESLVVAKKIVKKVVEELSKKLESEVKKSFSGKKILNSTNGHKSYNNLDIKRTIKANLKNYNKELGSLIVDNVVFNSRSKKRNKWSVVILVDESGSMLDSVIHSAIMASIFAKLPMIETKLVIFDTEVVDLSGYVEDPVETLMSIRLGGGTNITKALHYGESLITNPHRTIVLLVSDLYEGYSYGEMYRKVRDIVEGGSKLICLTALDDVSKGGIYDKVAGKKIANLGGQVAATTPGRLANWVSEIIS